MSLSEVNWRRLLAPDSLIPKDLEIRVVEGPDISEWKGNGYWVHKILVASVSEVLEAQFYGIMAEDKNFVYFENSSMETVRAFIDFIYSRPEDFSLDTLTMQNLFLLFLLADKFAMPTLSNKVIVAIEMFHLDRSNVLEVASIAEKYSGIVVDVSTNLLNRCAQHLPRTMKDFPSFSASLMSKGDQDLAQKLLRIEQEQRKLVLLVGPSPVQAFDIPGFTFESSDCHVPQPAIDEETSIFQELNGVLYVCNHQQSKMYDIEENTWRPVEAKFKTKRREAAGTVIGDKWVVQGGGSCTAEVWTPGTGDWEEAPQYTSPLQVYDHCIVNLNGKLMQTGGMTPVEGGWTNRCFIDGREVASMVEDRYGHASAVFQGRVWVAGGHWLGRKCFHVEIYDPGSDAWTNGPQLPMPKHDLKPQLVVHAGQLFYVGGRHIGKIYKLDQSEDSWEEVGDVEEKKKYLCALLKISSLALPQ